MNGSAATFQRPSSCKTTSNPTAPTSSSGWNCQTTWSLAKPFSLPATTTAPSRASCEARSSTPPSVSPDSPTPSASPTTTSPTKCAPEVAGTIPVTVAPTPELDELFQILVASMPAPGDDEPSYFAHGRVSADIVEMLFITSGALFAITPWTLADENQILRMDIPALGVDGACLSIIGQLGQSRGVLIFPSRHAFEQFLEAAANSDPEQPRAAFGAGVLSLTFHNATHLPPAMRREAMQHGWPVESPDAYPLVAHRDPDGIPHPLVERDVETVAACALALRAFLTKHAAIFKADPFTPVCESYFDDEDREVRFTVPYEAFDLFNVDESADQERDT